MGFSGGSDSKESACNVGDLVLIPGLGGSLGGGHGNPLQYSYLENLHGQRSLVAEGIVSQETLCLKMNTAVTAWGSGCSAVDTEGLVIHVRLRCVRRLGLSHQQVTRLCGHGGKMFILLKPSLKDFEHSFASV